MTASTDTTTAPPLPRALMLRLPLKERALTLPERKLLAPLFKPGLLKMTDDTTIWLTPAGRKQLYSAGA